MTPAPIRVHPRNPRFKFLLVYFVYFVVPLAAP